jgi:integrase-like protein
MKDMVQVLWSHVRGVVSYPLLHHEPGDELELRRSEGQHHRRGRWLPSRHTVSDSRPRFEILVRICNVLVREGVHVSRLPPRSPNLNAFAERFVRSIKEECLHRMIFFGQHRFGTRSLSI